jgi:hypothetical protein
MNEMETHEKWLKLVESSLFEELTKEELLFVEANGGEAKFRMDQRVILSLEKRKES